MMLPLRSAPRRAWRICCLMAMCVASRAAAQGPVTAMSGDPTLVAQIRDRFATIQREVPTYRTTSQNLHGFSLEGGRLTAYYRGAELRKLEARFYGEMWRSSEEYYFWGDSLFFVYVVIQGYDQPMSGNVRQTLERRYYFHRGRLIRRVVTERPHESGAGAFNDGEPTAADLLSNAKLFRACAAARSPSPPECAARER